MSHDDFDTEPIAGLPATPPRDEAILWQGSPQWAAVARRVMHLDLVAAYFGLMLAWRIGPGRPAGQSLAELVATLLPFMGLALLAIGILALLAWGVSRTTIYTITSRRVVMRFGVALPITFNIPFSKIVGAGVRDLGRGRGDIALELAAGERIAYLVLWPHVRPWRLRSPQPMLRGLVDAQSVGATLASALAKDGSGTQPVRIPVAARDDSGLEPRPALVAAE
jgi:hypothetical protein